MDARISRSGASLRSNTRYWALCASAAAIATAIACAEADSPSRQGPGSGEGGVGPTIADASRDDGGGDERTTGVLRVAHLAEGLSAIDLCYQPRGTATVTGPLFARGAADAGAASDAGAEGGAGDAGPEDAGDAGGPVDAAAPGLPYLGVSRYVGIEATGTLTLSIVRPGVGTCQNPLATGTVTVDPGKLVTVTITSRPDEDGGPPALGVTGYVDDRATEREKARVRFIHAALGTASAPPLGDLSVRAVAGRATVLAGKVASQKVGSSTPEVPLSPLGYASVAPVPAPAALELSADRDGGPTAIWLSPFGDLGLSGASLHTGFITSDGPGGASVVWCNDLATTVSLGACAVLR